MDTRCCSALLGVVCASPKRREAADLANQDGCSTQAATAVCSCRVHRQGMDCGRAIHAMKAGHLARTAAAAVGSRSGRHQAMDCGRATHATKARHLGRTAAAAVVSRPGHHRQEMDFCSESVSG